MKKFLLILISLITLSTIKAQFLELDSKESKFSYAIHRGFDFGAIYGDTNFMEKPAYLNVVFKMNKKYKIIFIEIAGRANELLKTEIEKSLRRALNKTSCDTLNLKVKTYYSFPLLFRIKHGAISRKKLTMNGSKPVLLGEKFRDEFYVDLISSFNEYKNLKVVFKKPVILLPIVDLETGRGNLINSDVK